MVKKIGEKLKNTIFVSEHGVHEGPKDYFVVVVVVVIIRGFVSSNGTKKCSIVMYGPKVFHCPVWTEKLFHSIDHKSIGNNSYKFIARGLVTERICSLVIVLNLFIGVKCQKKMKKTHIMLRDCLTQIR
jgi:hypothetical protein